MDAIPRTPNDQKCARASCHHPFAAHDIQDGCGCQLGCLACGCSDFAYPEDVPSSTQGINSTRKKIDHEDAQTQKEARAPGR